MASNQMQKLFQRADRGSSATHGISGILAGLFRTILADLGVSIVGFNSLMEDYIKDPINGVSNNPKEHTIARGNLNKELFKDKMTWRVFCKSLRVMQMARVRFVIEAYHRSGRRTIHSAMVSLAATAMPREDDTAEGMGFDAVEEAIGNLKDKWAKERLMKLLYEITDQPQESADDNYTEGQ